MTRNTTRNGTPTPSLPALLATHLPASWTVTPSSSPVRTLILRGPDGVVASLEVLSRNRLEPRDIDGLLRGPPPAQGHVMLVWAPYLSPLTQERIVELGGNYADATGNLRVALDRPALFLRTTGATKDPAPQPRPLASLRGAAAGRVVRALCDLRPPYGVRELAQRSGTPLGSVARVLGLLDREAIIVREGRGSVASVDWPKLLRRWTQDYALMTSNQMTTWLAPRGLAALTERLRTAPFRYAVTGSMPASMLAPVAAPRLATVFVESTSVADALDLEPAEAGANVLLVEPFDPVVFERTLMRDGLVLASPSQVVADLLTSPGRGPAEGQALLDWMARSEEVWRA